jgi:uncharacterized protein (TIGR02646 family)
MRTIAKNREPRSLTEHRLAPHANYDNYAGKDDLRRALVAEQRGLCCYCLGPIHPTADVMKIAHWHAQTTHPREQLHYRNLLGACRGGEGQPRRMQHCDTYQADRNISKNPADPADRVETLIRYRSDGSIASDDVRFDRELNDVLNLNMASLKNERKAVLAGFTDTIARRGQLERATLERWLRKWNGESDPGELQPFCQVVVYWLQKRLARGN